MQTMWNRNKNVRWGPFSKGRLKVFDEREKSTSPLLWNAFLYCCNFPERIWCYALILSCWCAVILCSLSFEWLCSLNKWDSSLHFTIFDKIWHFVISTIVVINKNLEFSLHPVDGCMRGNGMPRNARYSQKWEQILSPKMIIPWKNSSLMEGERGKWIFACWRFEE